MCNKGVFMSKKKVFPPIITVLGFIESLNLDAEVYSKPDCFLTANCVDKNTGRHVCKIEFEHYNIKCDEVKGILKEWIKYIFEHDKKYFYEFCDYHNKKAASTVRGDYRYIEYLKKTGFIPNTAENEEDKTIN